MMGLRCSSGGLGQVTRAVRSFAGPNSPHFAKVRANNQTEYEDGLKYNLARLPLAISSLRVFTNPAHHHGSKTMIRVPTMAESITEGTLIQFSRGIGEFVQQDDELATIETDKIDVSVNAPHSGILRQLLVGEGKRSPWTSKSPSSKLQKKRHLVKMKKKHQSQRKKSQTPLSK